MPFTVQCACGKKVRVEDQHRGKRYKCKQCGASLLLEPPAPLDQSLDLAPAIAAEQESGAAESEGDAGASRPAPSRRFEPIVKPSRKEEWKKNNAGKIKKLVIFVVLVAVAWGGYIVLFGPPHITLKTYAKIHGNMTRNEVESAFGMGYVRYATKDVSKHMQTEEEAEALKGVERVLQSEYSKDIATGNEANSASKQLMLFLAEHQDKFGPKRYDAATYSFRNHVVEVTINNQPYKVVMNGKVEFVQDAIQGAVVGWTGKGGRNISVIYERNRAAFWSYLGPAADFVDLPPSSVGETAR